MRNLIEARQKYIANIKTRQVLTWNPERSAISFDECLVIAEKTNPLAGPSAVRILMEYSELTATDAIDAARRDVYKRQ